MIPYSKFQPSAFDRAGLGCPNQQDWLVAPCSTTRDAGYGTRANWEAQLAALAKLPRSEETPDYEVHRFGHWGPGWFEIVLVRPGSTAASLCQGFEDSLADYPILDEESFSAAEWDEVCEYWTQLRPSERANLLSECRDNPRRWRSNSPPEAVIDRIRDMLPIE